MKTPDATYRDHLERGEFRIQYCGECEQHVFYPRHGCVHCGAVKLRWVVPSGRGVVYSVTVIARRPEKGGNYNVVLVDLAEGVRLMSRVDNIPADRVEIGMPVRAKVIRDGDEPLLVFEPEAAS
jgi:uncharacterized OB-fold protein